MPHPGRAEGAIAPPPALEEASERLEETTRAGEEASERLEETTRALLKTLCKHSDESHQRLV